jgi:hypothetical protein
MQNNTISIITVTRNNLSGLKRTFKSINEKLQNPNFKVDWVIVDGKSNDGSVIWLNEVNRLKNKNYSFRFISEQDKNMYEAMNKGIKIACGEFLLFLNSGDIITDEFNLIDIHLFSDINVFNINALDENLNPNLWKGLKKDKLYLKSYPCFPHQSTFIKKELLLLSRGYDTSIKYLADYDFFCKAAFIIKSDIKFFSDITPTSFIYDGISSDIKRRNIIQNEIEFVQKKYFNKIDFKTALINRTIFLISYLPYAKIIFNKIKRLIIKNEN